MQLNRSRSLVNVQQRHRTSWDPHSDGSPFSNKNEDLALRRNSMAITLGIKDHKLSDNLCSSPLFKTHPNFVNSPIRRSGRESRRSNQSHTDEDYDEQRDLLDANVIKPIAEFHEQHDDDWEELQDRMKTFMNTWYMSLITMTFTIYALYAEDCRVLLFAKSMDTAFVVMHIISAVYFFFELIVLIFCDATYRSSMYMPLDAIAFLSVLIDILLLTIDTGMGRHFAFARIFRVATRVGRLVRALRFIVAARQYTNTKVQYTDDIDQPREANRPMGAEVNSRFGRYLNVAVTKKVIILFLAMVLMIPLNEDNLQNPDDDIKVLLRGATGALAMCYDTSYPMCYSQEAKDSFLESYIQGYSKSLAKEDYPDSDRLRRSSHLFHDLSRLTVFINDVVIHTTERSDFSETVREKQGHTEEIEGSSNLVKVHAIFDITEQKRNDSKYNVVQTTLLIFVLVFVATSLQNYTVNYVILPVQRLLDAVRKMAKDPFHNWDDDEFEDPNSIDGYGAPSQEIEMENRDQSSQVIYSDLGIDNRETSNNSKRDEYEVEVLHRTVREISTLLGKGFGRAGWTIIRNAVQNTSSMDLLLPGKQMQGVFSFGQIRYFGAITDCLQEDIFTFVNVVAEIIHENTFKNKGATNKNIGDSFLSVWRFPHKVTVNNRLIKTQDMENLHFTSGIPLEITYLADRAFITVVKIIFAVLRSKALSNYYKNPKILKLLGNIVQKMGFGLHVGWAIEGAVGSRHKLDATYLSPNVNISARLETATAQYGVFVLLSGEFVNLLCRSAQRLCRPVDMVKVKGSLQKVDIYTIDIPLECARQVRPPKEPHMLSQVDQIYKWRHSFPCSTIEFRCDPDLVALKTYQVNQKKFLDEYLEGFSLYSRGDWELAHTWFKKALKLKPNDGPTKELVRVIESSNFTPSPTFVTKGRSLTRK